MSKLLRNLILFVLAAAVIASVTFRMLAGLREQYDPVTAAGTSAAFAEVKGLRIHYRQWGSKDGIPILLVHGTMAWSETWRDVAAPLGDAGYRVIALDMPPFGLSDRPSAQNYSREAQAALIRGFADAVGLDKFVLVGHSFGGGATIEAAFSMPERVRQLVLLDVALGLGQEGSAPALTAVLQARWLRNLAVASSFTNPLMLEQGLRSFVHDDGMITKERLAIYQWPLVMANTTDAVGDWMMTGLYGDETASRAADLASYAAFPRQVLLIWGREDDVTPLAQGQEIAGLFRDARLEVLDGVNHIPQVEKPDEVVRLISKFLRKPSGGSTKAAPPLASSSLLRGAVEGSE